MNPFEQFLRKLFGGGLPPSVIEEERQAANLGTAAKNMPKVAKELGKSFIDSYKQRAQDLQTLANQSVFPQVPLSDFETVQSPVQAQRDLALDVLSAGAGTGMRVGADILSSAPAVGGSVARNAALDRLRQNYIFNNPNPNPFGKIASDSWKQFGNTLEEARVNLSNILGRTPIRPEVAGAAEQIPIGHSSPYFYTAPEISRGTAKKGEGAALMGPGLYVAESPDVFEGHYRQTLARDAGLPTILNGQLPIDFYRIADAMKGAPEGKAERSMLSSLLGRIPRDFEVKGTQNALESYRDNLEFQYENLRGVQERLDKAKRILSDKGKTEYFNSQPDFIRNFWRRKPEELDKSYELVRQQAEKDVKNYTEFEKDAKKRIRRGLQNFNDSQSKLTRNFNINYPEKVVATYEGLLGAGPNELLQLDLPFYGLEGQNLEKVMQALGNFKSRSGASLADEYMQNMETATKNLPKMSPMSQEELLRRENSNLRDRLRQAAKDIQSINVNPLKGYSPTYQYTSLENDPFAIVDALRDQGIVGTKYADGISRRNFLANITDPEPATFNYTVFDPSRIQFTEAYGSANPFGPVSMAMQTLQKEQEKKNAKAPKASKK